MKFENSEWRFISPSPLPNGAVQEFFALARTIANQGRIHDILEDFKRRFAGEHYSRSSTQSWAESDLRIAMGDASNNAALFIESFVNACDDIRAQGYDVPSIDTINAVLTRNSAWLQIRHGELVRQFSVVRETFNLPDTEEFSGSEIFSTNGFARETKREASRAETSASSRTGPVEVGSGNPRSIAEAPRRDPTSPPFRYRQFLCHSSGDKDRVRELYRQMRERGFEPWLDEEDLVPGQDWDAEIHKAVRYCQVVLVCLSKRSTTKEGYVQREIRIALDIADEKPEGMIYIIPVLLEDCTIPSRLAKWHAVHLSRENGFDNLARALALRAGSPIQ